MGYQPKPPSQSPILLAKQTKWSPLNHCPKCDMDCTESHYCSSCNWMVHNRHGFDVATDHGKRVTLQEIRDFLHPPPLNAGKPITLEANETIAYYAERLKHIRDGIAPGVIITTPLPRSKPSGKYDPRPLAHEAKVSPWLWRCIYAAGSLITLGAAAVTLWQHLGG